MAMVKRGGIDGDAEQQGHWISSSILHITVRSRSPRLHYGKDSPSSPGKDGIV